VIGQVPQRRLRIGQCSFRLAPCQTVCTIRCDVKFAIEFVGLNRYNQAGSVGSLQRLYCDLTRQYVEKCQRETAKMSVRVLYVNFCIFADKNLSSKLFSCCL